MKNNNNFIKNNNNFIKNNINFIKNNNNFTKYKKIFFTIKLKKTFFLYFSINMEKAIERKRDAISMLIYEFKDLVDLNKPKISEY